MSIAKVIPIRPDMTRNVARAEALKQQDHREQDLRVEKLTTSDKNVINANKKLITNLEKLTKAIKKSAEVQGKVGAGGRGEELAKAQKLDYRSTGQMIKEKFTGRGGDKFDDRSFRYKLGSVRGLLNTTGLVEKGSGGYFDNLLGRREERKKGADTLAKLNPQMKNLKQFGGDQAKVDEYYAGKMKEAQAAKRQLQTEQEKLDALRASGMSDEEIARTTGGSRQIGSRNKAAANLVDVDPRLKGEKLAALGAAANKGQSQDLSESELETLEINKENAGVMTELLDVTKAEIERKIGYDAELLAAVKAIEIGGGEGDGFGIGDAANLLGKRGGKGKAGKLGKTMKTAGKLGKFAKVGGAALAVGMGAYEAYEGWSDADKQLASGEITKDQADVKKSAAVGKGTGGAGGALAGAAAGAAIGSVVPVVGTAIGGLVGGALGYWGGSKAGEAIGEYGAKSYKSLTKEDPNAPKKETVKPRTEMDAIKEMQAKHKAETQRKEAAKLPNNQATAIAKKSMDNDAKKAAANTKPSATVIDASSTNVSKQTSNNLIKAPVHNQEPTINQYYRSRFAT